MSKIALTPNASGTGTLTIAAPNTSTDRTLTLPDSTGTVDTLSRAGNVLQVVNSSFSTYISTTSSTFTDFGLNASITPTSAANKILVLVGINGLQRDGASGWGQLRLLRGSSFLSAIEGTAGYTGSSGSSGVGGVSINYLDSPSTTSSTNYKIQMATGGGSFLLNNYGTAGVISVSTMTLMEIAA